MPTKTIKEGGILNIISAYLLTLSATSTKGTGAPYPNAPPLQKTQQQLKAVEDARSTTKDYTIVPSEYKEWLVVRHVDRSEGRKYVMR